MKQGRGRRLILFVGGTVARLPAQSSGSHTLKKYRGSVASLIRGKARLVELTARLPTPGKQQSKLFIALRMTFSQQRWHCSRARSQGNDSVAYTSENAPRHLKIKVAGVAQIMVEVAFKFPPRIGKFELTKASFSIFILVITTALLRYTHAWLSQTARRCVYNSRNRCQFL